MKSRIIWAVIVLAAIAGFYVVTIRPTRYSSPGFSRKNPPLRNLKPPDIPPPPLPAPVVVTPTLAPPPLPTQPIVAKREMRRPMPPPEVPIQNNATIDFSIGAPVVRSGGKDQEALDKALREIAEATKNTTFPAQKQ